MKLRYYMRGLGIGIIVTAILLGITVSGKKESLSDSEIRERAEKLGMVESGVLAKDLGEKEKEVSENRVLQQPTVSGANPKDLVDDPEELSETADEQKATALSPAQADTIDGGEKAQTDSGEAAGEEAEDRTEGEMADAKEASLKDKEETPAENDSETRLVDAPEGKENSGGGKITVTSGTEVTVTVASGDGSYAVAKKLEAAGAVKSADAFDAFLCSEKYDRILVTGKHTIPPGASEEEIAKILTGKR